ncbi:MAG TPA: hypothetical protein VL574_16930 [Stellaceae bacterium]|nr:hypothetical protein [Stellaceae bacterium]
MARRKFEPTDEQRKTARAMAAYGIPHPDIATVFEIDAKTLRKHFRRELTVGSIEANAKVGESLFNQAIGRFQTIDGKVTVITEPSVAAAIFWMKTRVPGWSEKTSVIHQHKHQGNVDLNIRNATSAELEAELAEIERRERAANQAGTVAAAVPEGSAGLVH